MKKLLVGLLALSSVSTFANCQVAVDFSQSRNFRVLPQSECPSCGDAYYERLGRKADRRYSEIEALVAEKLSKKGFIYQSNTEKADYTVTLKQEVFRKPMPTVTITINDTHGEIEKKEIQYREKFYTSFYKDQMNALDKVLDQVETSCI